MKENKKKKKGGETTINKKTIKQRFLFNWTETQMTDIYANQTDQLRRN